MTYLNLKRTFYPNKYVYLKSNNVPKFVND